MDQLAQFGLVLNVPIVNACVSHCSHFVSHGVFPKHQLGQQHSAGVLYNK